VIVELPNSQVPLPAVRVALILSVGEVLSGDGVLFFEQLNNKTQKHVARMSLFIMGRLDAKYMHF